MRQKQQSSFELQTPIKLISQQYTQTRHYAKLRKLFGVKDLNEIANIKNCPSKANSANLGSEQELLGEVIGCLTALIFFLRNKAANYDILLTSDKIQPLWTKQKMGKLNFYPSHSQSQKFGYHAANPSYSYRKEG